MAKVTAQIGRVDSNLVWLTSWDREGFPETEWLAPPRVNIGGSEIGIWEVCGPGFPRASRSCGAPLRKQPQHLGFPDSPSIPSSAPPLRFRPGRAGSSRPGASLELRTPFQARGQRWESVPTQLPWRCFVLIKSASAFLSPFLPLCCSLPVSPQFGPPLSISRSRSSCPSARVPLCLLLRRGLGPVIPPRQ